ncbi:hypothetical protein [Marinilabilia sp.]|nr:hypothetical protein [Marinilabilia sp.]
MIWGLAWMILFVPVLAILKILSCNSPVLEPIRFLLENDKKS